MAKREERKLLIGLDIGTSKVVAIVGELSSENTLEVIGIGSHPSRGLKRGVVVNIVLCLVPLTIFGFKKMTGL